MALDTRRYVVDYSNIIRDVRPLHIRAADRMQDPKFSFAILVVMGACYFIVDGFALAGDFVFFFSALYFWWLTKRKRFLAFRVPMGAKFKDPSNTAPGRNMRPEGILYMGNMKKTNEEIWFTNSDARTHILYLGTTGSGKTEGLKSIVTNAMAWGSGFIYVDGKADTDLWSSLSSLCRRFGRDDDLLVLNYMTGNSDTKAASNSMNPFSSGSASYLTNMLVSLMPDADGDNAMWKERAVSLVSAMMPAMLWKRDNQDMRMNVGTIREFLTLNKVIQLSRDQAIPLDLRNGLLGYLDTLPGYVAEAFSDDGKDRAPGPDVPAVDNQTPRQQHGYLSMQFTRSLQSLGDDYGYIFNAEAADVDMLDVVLNRRILVVLIPALEKSGDEIANLGKIVATTLKGMMGSTLGSMVEGESATVIENKPTHSATPFITVFDEVGYYTAAGMAVMAAQARSLGFSLVYSAQDLPALEKRVKEEARSITANCNIKIFGKLEDPTQTKEFFEKTVGDDFVTEMQSMQLHGDMQTGGYYDTKSAGVKLSSKASYGELQGFKEGDAIISFNSNVIGVDIFFSNPGFARAMRVTRYVALPQLEEAFILNAPIIAKVRDNLVRKDWTAKNAYVAAPIDDIFETLADEMDEALNRNGQSPAMAALCALVGLYAQDNDIDAVESQSDQQIVRQSHNLNEAKNSVDSIIGLSGLDQMDLSPAEPADGVANPMAFFGYNPPAKTEIAEKSLVNPANPMDFFASPNINIFDPNTPPPVPVESDWASLQPDVFESDGVLIKPIDARARAVVRHIATELRGILFPSKADLYRQYEAQRAAKIREQGQGTTQINEEPKAFPFPDLQAPSQWVETKADDVIDDDDSLPAVPAFPFMPDIFQKPVPDQTENDDDQ